MTDTGTAFGQNGTQIISAGGGRGDGQDRGEDLRDVVWRVAEGAAAWEGGSGGPAYIATA